MLGRDELRLEIEALRKQLEEANRNLERYRVAEEQRKLDEAAAQKIADKKIPFRTMPDEVYPGMRYLKCDDVARISEIKYHPAYIRRLAQDNSENGIPSVVVDGEILLTPRSIEALLVKQAIKRGGRKPGDRKRLSI